MCKIDKPIHILYLIDFMNFFSGTEKHLYDLVRFINKEKFKPFIITLEGTELFQENVEKLGIPMQILGLKKIYGFKAVVALLRLRKFIKKENIQIIQTFHTNADLFGTVLGQLTGVPIIVSSRRDMGFTRNFRNHLSYKFINFFIDGVICVSEAVKNFTLKKEGIPKNKLTVIYNGVDTSLFNKDINIVSVKSSLNLSISAPTIGMLANFNPIKGHLFFLEAIKLTRRQIPDIQCVLVGRGDRENLLRQKCQDLRIDDCVHFLGHRSDIPELLAIMDILVVSSLTEGFSNTILEALNMKRPVVATAVGGNPEVITHGRTGILVPSKNVQELASGIVSLINNKDLARRFGENGQKLVREKFLIEMMIKKTEDFYLSLLKRKKLING